LGNARKNDETKVTELPRAGGFARQSVKKHRKNTHAR